MNIMFFFKYHCLQKNVQCQKYPYLLEGDEFKCKLYYFYLNVSKQCFSRTKFGSYIIELKNKTFIFAVF